MRIGLSNRYPEKFNAGDVYLTLAEDGRIGILIRGVDGAESRYAEVHGGELKGSVATLEKAFDAGIEPEVITDSGFVPASVAAAEGDADDVDYGASDETALVVADEQEGPSLCPDCGEVHY